MANQWLTPHDGATGDPAAFLQSREYRAVLIDPCGPLPLEAFVVQVARRRAQLRPVSRLGLSRSQPPVSAGPTGALAHRANIGHGSSIEPHRGQQLRAKRARAACPVGLPARQEGTSLYRCISMTCIVTDADMTTYPIEAIHALCVPLLLASQLKCMTTSVGHEN